MLSSGAVAMISTPVYHHPIFPPFAWKLNFWSFLAIFHHLCLLMDDPVTTSPLWLKKMSSFSTVAIISNKRKPVKAITDSFSPLPHATMRAKMEKWLFPHLCTPMGLPWAFFSFFPGIMWWEGVVALISSKESGTLPFFIIFLPLLLFSPKFAIFAHFGHFAHPHGSPLITSDPNL